MAKFGSDHWHHSQRWMAGRAANTKPGVMRAVLRQESLLIIFVSIFMPVKCVFSIVACRSHVKGSGKREVGEDGMGGWDGEDGWRVNFLSFRSRGPESICAAEDCKIYPNIPQARHAKTNCS